MKKPSPASIKKALEDPELRKYFNDAEGIKITLKRISKSVWISEATFKQFKACYETLKVSQRLALEEALADWVHKQEKKSKKSS